MNEKPANRKNTGRNPDGTFKSGVSGNPNGRPKDTLKEYIRKKLSNMTDEEKEEYIKPISKDLQWRMGEGNPHQTTDGHLEVTLPKPLMDVTNKDED